jgi:putative ABC transport system permease protein
MLTLRLVPRQRTPLFIMHRWLEGFAYHVDLSPSVFLLASALALSIALATISSHTWTVARAKPAQAPRCE